MARDPIGGRSLTLQPSERARQFVQPGTRCPARALIHGNRSRRESLGLSRQPAGNPFLGATHWKLILSLTKRDLAERFQGSLLGPLWFVITPAILILTYTLVFGMVFKVRVPFGRTADTSNLEFGLFLFSGLLIFTVFRTSSLAHRLSSSPGRIS